MIAFSPSSVVWANTGIGLDGAGWPLRSSWTFQGKPLPFVPCDVSKLPTPHNGLMRYRAYHEENLTTFADAVPRAGGTDEADRELGRNAWSVIADVCELASE